MGIGCSSGAGEAERRHLDIYRSICTWLDDTRYVVAWGLAMVVKFPRSLLHPSPSHFLPPSYLFLPQLPAPSTPAPKFFPCSLLIHLPPTPSSPPSTSFPFSHFLPLPTSPSPAPSPPPPSLHPAPGHPRFQMFRTSTRRLPRLVPLAIGPARRGFSNSQASLLRQLTSHWDTKWYRV